MLLAGEIREGFVEESALELVQDCNNNGNAENGKNSVG